MPNTLLVKRTTVAGRVPTTAQLEAGELAVNVPDGKLYLKQEGASTGIVEIGPVRSVAGRAGDVAMSVDDVSGAAPLASPAFSGTPTSPTPSTADNSMRLATTAFVKAQGYVTSATAGVSAVTGTAPIVSSGGATPAISILAATTSAPGSMSAADKAKLDGIAAGAQVNVPTNLGITGTADARTITSSTGTNVTLPVATTSVAGLMAIGDKAKLDGIAAGAQVNVATNLGVSAGTTSGPTITSSTGSNVTLPAASTTASGVVTTGAQSWAGAKTFTGVVTAPDFVTTSDARLKTVIAPITNALAKLQHLQGVTFEMAGDPRPRMGLLAQDVQAVAPEAVIEAEGVLRLAYGNLIGLLVEAIKDLAQEVDQLKRTTP
jgi:hypothetical protein